MARRRQRGPARPHRPGAARARGDPGRDRAALRRRVRQRAAAPAEAGTARCAHPLRDDRRGGLRELRPLRRAHQLHVAAQGGDRVRAEDAGPPVELQPGPVLPGGRLPLLPHRRRPRRRPAQAEAGAGSGRRGAGAGAATARSTVPHHHPGRRRDRRDHAQLGAGLGGAARRQGGAQLRPDRRSAEVGGRAQQPGGRRGRPAARGQQGGARAGRSPPRAGSDGGVRPREPGALPARDDRRGDQHHAPPERRDDPRRPPRAAAGGDGGGDRRGLRAVADGAHRSARAGRGGVRRLDARKPHRARRRLPGRVPAAEPSQCRGGTRPQRHRGGAERAGVPLRAALPA